MSENFTDAAASIAGRLYLAQADQPVSASSEPRDVLRNPTLVSWLWQAGSLSVSRS